MTKPLLIVTAVGSLCIGFGSGYIFAEKRLSAQFDERLKKETAGMREFYQVAKKPFATPQEAAAELLSEEPESEVVETITEVTRQKVAYHKIVETNYEKPEVDPEEELAIEAEIAHSRGAVDRNLFNEKPHIISQEEFMQNDSGYVQTTVTYYQGDQVLTDERENRIEDLDETVGEGNMVMFGTNSSDPNVLHIRNGRLQMEFEVCLSQNSYTQEVLGIDELPVNPPSGRKRS